jgi:predicted O-methyltransferase YrrM/glycosyltransferase involved in cell wall biosynthesis
LKNEAGIRRICIVTTRHISYNPRVLKEADALHAGGYEVSVVTIDNHDRLREFDREQMRSRGWRLKTVNFSKNKEYATWLYLSLRQRVFGALARLTFGMGFAERAAERAYDGLVRLAKKEKADLYIAHHAEALGAAWDAARHNGAKLGFDAEDFHTGMDEGGPTRNTELVAWLEAKYLKKCQYITAASKGIAEAYASKYGIVLPRVILNVFPYEELPEKGVHSPVRFYWYSQVIGPYRGVELLLKAAAKIEDEGFEIHLRGRLYSDEYKEQLKGLVGRPGLWERIYFHEPIVADQIIREGNGYDVGMALESPVSVNRNICVTNKTFSYLMSRLFIIGTDTYGQKDIFSHFPEATRMCRAGDEEDLAAAMTWCIRNPGRLLDGKRAAGAAVKGAFNWEVESEKLLGYIKPNSSVLKPVSLHSSIHRDEAEFISRLIRENGLSRAVEVGCAMGVSSLAIADSLAGEGAFHYIIDPFQKSQWKNIGVSNLRKAGFSRFQLIEDYSEFALPALVKEGVKINFGFIDGWHTFDHTLIDFFYINRMLEVGGIVLIDDVQMPAVSRVARYIYNYPGYEYAGSVKNADLTAKRRLFEGMAAVLSKVKFLTGAKVANEVLNSKMVQPDRRLNLDCTMIAFKKVAEDKRDWNWYENF